MKNRKREICTSGSVRDEAGQLIYSAVDNFYIWQRALPRCRSRRMSQGRKPIRRGRCASLWDSCQLLSLTTPNRRTGCRRRCASC